MLKLKIFYSLKKIGFFNSLYKKSIFYFLPLIFAIILAPEFVSANILMPGVADGFIYSIPLLIFSPGVILFILPILIGFMFDRRFIAKWNFISLLIVLTTVKLFFVLIETEIYFELIFLLLLYSSFFTIIAFISSTIGKNYKKIYDIQEKFYNVSAKYKILILLILYSLIISPMIYVSSFTPSDYTESLLILSGAIASVLIASLLLLTISKSQTIKPEKKLRFHKKDNHYLSIIITIFIITLILAFIFYPSSSLDKPSPDIQTKTHLEYAFEEMKGNYGSMQQYTFSIPREITKVCFLDKNIADEYEHMRDLNMPLCDEHPHICEVWVDPSQNIAFEPDLGTRIEIRDVLIKDGQDNCDGKCICKEIIDGRFGVTLVGRGYAVEVRE